MRRFYKFLKYLVLIVGLIVILLFSVAEFAEDRIAQISINQINKSVGLPVTYGDIDFSLLRDFPLATLEISDVWVGTPSSDLAKSPPDTLAIVSKFFVAVRMLPLIREQKFDLMEIDIVGAEGYYLVDTTGKSNIDFLIDTTQTDVVDTTSSELSISLRQLEIEDMVLNYHDRSKNIFARLEIPEVTFNGQMKNGNFESAVDGMALLSECGFEETNLCLMQQTRLDFNIEYIKDSVKIHKAFINSDGAEVTITGKAGLSDSIFTQLKVEAPTLDLGELIKYIPQEILYDYGINSIDGDLTLDGTLEGCLSDSLIPNMAFSFDLKNGSAKMEGYPPVNHISLSGNYDNGVLRNLATTTLTLNKVHIETPESQATLEIALHNLEKINYTASMTANIDLAEVKNYYLPDSVVRSLDGRARAQFATRGIMPETIDSSFIDYLAQNSQAAMSFDKVNIKMDSVPAIDSCSFDAQYAPNQLVMKNLTIQIPGYSLNIRDGAFRTRFTGNLSNYQQMILETDSFSLATEKSRIEAAFYLSNLFQPEYQLSTDINIDLEELALMVPDSLVTSMSGKINAQMKSGGTIRPDSLLPDMEKLLFEKTAFNTFFRNVTVEMPDTLMQIKNLSGRVAMANDTIEIRKTSGQYAGINFTADSTKIVRMYAAFFQKKPEKFLVEGKFGIDHIDYSMFGVFLEEDSLSQLPPEETGKNNAHPSPALKYQIKGTAAVNSIKYDKSLIENASCLFNISNDLYIIDQLKFNAFDGTLNNSIRYETAQNQRTVILYRSEIDSMDISKLLYEFDNFGQEEISYEQLSGKFSTKMDGRFLMHGDSLIMDSTKIKGDLKLVDGGLLNYRRAIELGEFTNLEELNNIQFKTMETQLFVFNNAMYVPRTDIRSNAMNISAFGMQTFGEDYQYHLRIYLGEILHGKTKRIRKKQEAMGDNPDDKKSGLRSLYVQASSIKGNSKNGLDKKSDRLQMQTKINVQERILSIIFHPLLVDFNTGVTMEIPSLKSLNKTN
jgi:hypothetical protein